MKRFTILMFVAFLLMIATSGCNAMRGAGSDLSDTGKHISNIGN